MMREGGMSRISASRNLRGHKKADGPGSLDQRHLMLTSEPFKAETQYIFRGECLECGAMRRAFLSGDPKKDRIQYAPCEFCHPQACPHCGSPMQVEGDIKQVVCSTCGSFTRITFVSAERNQRNVGAKLQKVG